MSTRLERSKRCGSLRFTTLASLGVVLELFFEEKQLFAGCKYKLGVTVYALQYLVLEFHRKKTSGLCPCTAFAGLFNFLSLVA